jgi:hypothetical protein
MKKLLLLGAVVCLTQIAFSQTTRFGIRGGLNLTNVKIKATYMGQTASQSGTGIATFHIGGMADIPLSEHFSVQPSLLLDGKGSNFDDGSGGISKIRPYYLELPILLIAKTELPNTNFSIFGGAGPSVGYGLFGKATSQGQSEDVFSSNGFKRFDFGIDLAAGVELPAGFQFSFHFVPGLVDIGPGSDPSTPDLAFTVKNKVIQFSIGYFFGAASK